VQHTPAIDASPGTEVLAVIPARSGSKGIAHKNIRPFRGLPLLAHSVVQARESTLVTRTIVSTDSAEYARIGRQFGAETPFLRPAEISGDLSSDLEVFLHALEWLEREEGYRPAICVHLRPTYPLRTIADIDAMIQILLDNPRFDSARSVAPARETPFKMWFRDAQGALRPVVAGAIPDAHSLPRQALPPVFLQNACIDVVRAQVIRERRSMTGDRVYGHLMNDNFDIDTERDFQSAIEAATAGRHGPPVASVNASVAYSRIERPARRTLCIDIDGVLATTMPPDRYHDAEPVHDVITSVNSLFDAGHEIVLFTARGSATGIDWHEVTERQMRDWGVRYHRLVFGKPAADYYVDDRALLPDEFKRVSADLSGAVGREGT
jgi:CMP-N-acetylneuraminic acid synthetase